MRRYLDLQHHTFKMVADGMHLAPISKPQRVLDLATGTGIWAIEFGKSPPLSVWKYYSEIMKRTNTQKLW
jgi:ubiquinone/menaquinone biosynthesis C-methylase UbiE